MQTKYTVIGYRIDLYFHKHKLAIEVDELGHADRNLNNETERQKALETELDCVFITISWWKRFQHLQRNKQNT